MDLIGQKSMLEVLEKLCVDKKLSERDEDNIFFIKKCIKNFNENAILRGEVSHLKSKLEEKENYINSVVENPFVESMIKLIEKVNDLEYKSNKCESNIDDCESNIAAIMSDVDRLR